MKVYRIFLLILVFAAPFSACELLKPEDDNHSNFDRVYGEPVFAEGLLIRAYTYIPTNDYRYDEVATDDAVTNNKLSSYLRIATGEWSALYNPQNEWDDCNRAINYVNLFLTVVDTVQWKWTNDALNALYIRRLKGEAYALRGMFKYFLLKHHGGIGTNGQLLGTPIYNEFLKDEEGFSSPRATFLESVISAKADFTEALKYIPLDYGNLGGLEDLPAGFNEISDISHFNTVFGDVSQQRMSGRHVKAFDARLDLLAARPAFNEGNNTDLWITAANSSGELLDDIGGISGLDPKGNVFYLKAQVDDADITTGNKKDIAEILWRRPIYTNRSREQSNFPPSLYGSGTINPTQNFVDAFPMANGYPIEDANSGYNPANPYEGRDPRLALAVVYDGSKLKNTTINTGVRVGDDGLDAVQNSTRTGYYLKKLLREDVNVNPTSTSDQKHFNTHIRYTEIFLNYAEAANEAWGPGGTGTFGFSAKDVIGAIRNRGGISQPDEYLASIGSKEQMRELIRNERRIELSFESFRFWDLRRWKADLSVPARGIRIENGNYSVFTVEERAYDNNYMHYGPIPDKEVVKFNLIQNKGWN